MKKFYQVRHGRNLTGNLAMQKTAEELPVAGALNKTFSENKQTIEAKPEKTNSRH